MSWWDSDPIATEPTSVGDWWKADPVDGALNTEKSAATRSFYGLPATAPQFEPIPARTGADPNDPQAQSFPDFMFQPKIQVPRMEHAPDEGMIAKWLKSAGNVGGEFISGASAPMMLAAPIPALAASAPEMVPAQIQRVQEAGKTPAGSPERIEAGLSTAAMLGLGAKGIREGFKPSRNFAQAENPNLTDQPKVSEPVRTQPNVVAQSDTATAPQIPAQNERIPNAQNERSVAVESLGRHPQTSQVPQPEVSTSPLQSASEESKTLGIKEANVNAGPSQGQITLTVEPDTYSRVHNDRKVSGVTIIARDSKGETVGAIEAEHLKDGTLQVYNSNLAPELKGQGHGIELYEKLIQEAKGAPIVSDTSVSASAANVWESLKRRGLLVEKNPNAVLKENRQWSSGDGKPVFSIRQNHLSSTASELGLTFDGPQADGKLQFSSKENGSSFVVPADATPEVLKAKVEQVSQRMHGTPEMQAQAAEFANKRALREKEAATVPVEPTGRKELPPHMIALLEKAKKYDEQREFTVTDVTPEGFGPQESTAESYTPFNARDAHWTTEQQSLKRAISEAETLLRGNVSGEKRAAIERSLASAQEKLANISDTGSEEADRSDAGASLAPKPDSLQKSTVVSSAKSYESLPRESVSVSQPETTPTSTKNATTALERESRGLPEAEQAAKRDFGTVWDEAESVAKSDPTAPQRLVESLKNSPRALSDQENALLLRRQIEVQNEHSSAVEALNSAPDDPALVQRLESARNAVQDVYDAGKAAGTETGRGLNARRMLANNDFTLAKMEAETRAVANAGRPLSAKQAAEVKALHERVRAAESKLSAYEARDVLKEGLKQARAQRKPFSTVQFLEEHAVKAKERIKSRTSQLYSDPLGVTNVAHLADEAIIGAAHIARGVRNLKEWSTAMIKDFGEGIKPYLKALYSKSLSMHSDAARLAAAKSRTVTQTVKTLSKIGANDLEPTRPVPIKPDRELMQLRANLQRAKDEYTKRLERQRQAAMPFLKRAANTVVKGERAMKLTGITTLGKLGGAGVTRLASSVIEEAVGGILSKLPLISKIASEAPREGGFSAKAELAAPTKGFARGVRNIPDILKGQRTNEEALYGNRNQHLYYESGSMLDIPGRVHGAIKSPFKEAERERSTIKRQIHEEKAGGDISDPATEQAIGESANIDANRAIFMQDNVLSDWFRSGVRSLETSKKFPNAGFAMAKVANFLLPIVKVPTNVAFETITHMGGALSASGKLIQVMRRGLQNMKPEEADMIMRHYKKGAVGAGLFLTGYFNSDKFGGFYQPGEKRDDKDVRWASARIGGVNIPAWLLHAPAFIVLQAGSTAYRVSHMVKKGEMKGGLSATMAVAEGLAHEIPFVNEMSRLDKILADSWEGTKARGDLLRSTVVPQGVQNVAGWMDEAGQEARRSPKTEMDYLKMGVPGLREQVPFATYHKEDRAKAMKVMTPQEREKFTQDEIRKKIRERESRQMKKYLNSQR